MLPTQKKKNKTGIPVIKNAHRNGSGDVESTASSSNSQTSQLFESCQSQSNVATNHPHCPQLSSRSVKPKTVKKNKCPETWADEVIQSQSQKLRSTTMSEARRRQEDMERHLKEAEGQLETMGNLLEQREQLMKEAAEEAAKKNAELEHKLQSQDVLLIKYGIDPVTGEKIILGEEEENKVEVNQKVTKKKVQEMRAKLKQMNNQASSYLSEIENTLQYLNNLETISNRIGQESEECFDDRDAEEFMKMLNQDRYNIVASGLARTSIIRDDDEDEREYLNIEALASESINAEFLLYKNSSAVQNGECDNGDEESVNQEKVS